MDYSIEDLVEGVLHKFTSFTSGLFCCTSSAQDADYNCFDACTSGDPFSEVLDDLFHITHDSEAVIPHRFSVDMDSLPAPQRVAPAAPKGVDHDAIDASLIACRTLEDFAPPPRAAPSLSSSSWNTAHDFRTCEELSSSRSCGANRFPTDRPGSYVLHVKTGSKRPLSLGFVEGEDLEKTITLFLSQNNLPLSLKEELLRRARNLAMLGLQGDIVDIGVDSSCSSVIVA